MLMECFSHNHLIYLQTPVVLMFISDANWFQFFCDYLLVIHLYGLHKAFFYESGAAIYHKKRGSV